MPSAIIPLTVPWATARGASSPRRVASFRDIFSKFKAMRQEGRKIWALKMRKVYVRKYIPASFDYLSLGEKKADK